MPLKPFILQIEFELTLVPTQNFWDEDYLQTHANKFHISAKLTSFTEILDESKTRAMLDIGIEVKPSLDISRYVY